MTRAVAVDIVLCVHNGARFIAEQIRSIQSQTHQDWRLWIRDDGSSDDSLKVVEQIAGEDDRIHVFPPDGQRLGAGPGFGWLLEQLSGESRYVFFSDADDVWMPEKMELSLAAMLRAESHPGPVLVHTDLVVVDERLQTIRDSLWRHLRISPEPVSLCRLLAHNVVTGPTMLINRLLHIDSNTIHMCLIRLYNYSYHSELCRILPVALSLCVHYVPVYNIRYFIRGLGIGFAQTPRQAPA